MKGSYKFGLTGARCLILCAAAALIGCAIYLFSVSQVEAALDRSWFPFAQLQALTAGMDGKTPESVCLVLAALPVFGFIAQLLRNRFKPEDLLLLLSAVLLYLVMKNPLTLEGIFTQPTVQPAVFWTALLAWAGLRILRASCAAEGAPPVLGDCRDMFLFPLLPPLLRRIFLWQGFIFSRRSALRRLVRRGSFFFCSSFCGRLCSAFGRFRFDADGLFCAPHRLIDRVLRAVARPLRFFLCCPRHAFTSASFSCSLPYCFSAWQDASFPDESRRVRVRPSRRPCPVPLCCGGRG